MSNETKQDLEIEPKKTMNFTTVVLSLTTCAAFALSAFNYYQQSLKPQFVTINVPKVIDSQVKKIDKSIQASEIMPSEEQLKRDVEKYSNLIKQTLSSYTKKNNLIVFEKGSIISSGVEIKDITEEFIKAINE